MAIKGDTASPPPSGDPWVNAIGASFSASRCDRLNTLGTLVFNADLKLNLLDIVFAWSHPKRFFSLLVMPGCGAAISVWEGTRKLEKRTILTPKTLRLPTDPEGVVSRFEASAAACSGFADWQRYPLLSRQIWLMWKEFEIGNGNP